MLCLLLFTAKALTDDPLSQKTVSEFRIEIQNVRSSTLSAEARERLLADLLARAAEDRSLDSLDHAALADLCRDEGGLEFWMLARDFAVASRVRGGELNLAHMAETQDRIMAAFGVGTRFGTLGGLSDDSTALLVLLEFGPPYVGSAASSYFESEAAYLSERLRLFRRREDAGSEHPNPQLSETLGELCASRKPEVLPDDWRELVVDAVENLELVDADDFYHAGFVLAQSALPADLLLAHELIVISVALGHPGAELVYCETWDKVCQAFGMPIRYGTLPGSEIDPLIGRALRRILGIEF